MSDVLIVDDEPALITALKVRLQSSGHGVRVATNGAQALQEVGERLPGVILLDIQLPDMDGFQIFEQLREQLGDATPPIIFVSAMVQGPARARSLELGATAFFTKPYDSAAVLAAVANAVSLAPN